MRSGHVAALLVIAGCAASAVASFRHDKLTIPQNPPAPSSPQTPPAPFVATVQNESEWRADRVPATWPQFSVNPLAKPVTPVPAKQAIANAETLFWRWDAFRLGKVRQMPRSECRERQSDRAATRDPRNIARFSGGLGGLHPCPRG